MSSLPSPQGKYALATRHDGLIFTAGMTPRLNGVLQSFGPVPADGQAGQFHEAIVLASQNAVRAAESVLGDGERIGSILQMTVFVMAEAGFKAHSTFADVASNVLSEQFGPAGVCSRTAVGVSSLPGGASIEIQLVAAVAT